MTQEVIKLWHDDVRPAPAGWTWAKTNAEAIALLETGRVVECSLDHDLGADPNAKDAIYLAGSSPDGSGLDLACWMVENGHLPEKITIHSWNPDGAMRMARKLADAGAHVLIQPFKLPDPFAHLYEAADD